MTMLPVGLAAGATGHVAWTNELHAWRNLHLGEFRVGPPASGTASGKDKARVASVINAAKASVRGGLVEFDSGFYDVGDLAVTWPEFNVTGKAIGLKGATDKATVCKFSTDRGSGACAVAGDYAGGALRSDQGGLYENFIMDMRLIGPGTRGAMGTSPASMDGVMLDTHVRLIRADISLFRSGIICAGNHNHVLDCTLGNNYYGAYHTAVAGLGGDVVFTNTSLAGNLKASHAIAPTAVASFPMDGGHLGFNPYAIYLEGGRTAGQVCLYHCTFDRTSIEYLGNGFIYSEDQNAAIDEVRLYGCANFSSNNATYGLPSSAHTTQIRLHSMSRCAFDRTWLAGSPTQSWVDVTTSLSDCEFDFGKRMIDQAATAGLPLILGPAAASNMDVRLKDPSFRAIAMPCDSATFMVSGQLAETTQFGRARPGGYAGASARTPLVGVCVNGPAAGGREWALIVKEARTVDILLDGTAPTGNQVLVPSDAQPAMVKAANWNGTASPHIGMLYFGGPAGKVTARVNIP